MTDDAAKRISALDTERRALLEAALATAPSAVDRAVPRIRSGPLSHMQVGIWNHMQISPTPSLYHRLLALRLEGALDLDALRAALRDVEARHPAFRTRFLETAAGPTQEIVASRGIDLVVVGLDGDPDWNDERVADQVVATVEPPFDLESGRTLRSRLVRLADDRHLLLMCAHHLISDGSSDRLLTEDLVDCYRSRRDGGEPQRPVDRATHVDFAAAPRGHESGGASAYWRQTLTALPRPALAADHPHSGPLSGRGAMATRAVPPTLDAAARRLAGTIGVTSYAVWLAAYLIALREHSGCGDDVIVGVPSSGRSGAAAEDRTIGLFVRTLPLRFRAPATLSFAELAVHVHRTTLDALPHQDFPLEGLLAAARPDARQLSELVPLGFSFHDFGAPRPSDAVVSVRPVRLDTGTAKTALTLYVWRDAAETTLGLEYSTDVFTAATASVLLDRVTALLQAATADATAGIGLMVDDGTEMERLYRRSNLTHGQLLMWTDEQIRSGTPRYTIAVAYDLDSPIDPHRFASALMASAAESDALTSRFVVRDGVPWQEPGDRPNGGHDYLDLSAEPDPAAAGERICADLARRHLPPGGPLFSSLLIRLGPGRHTWLFRCHHLVFDGWSAGVLFDRVQRHYRSEATEPMPRFADHVREERDFAGSRRHRLSRAHWKDRLAASQSIQDIDARPRGTEVDRIECSLGVERTSALRSLAASLSPDGAVTDLAVLRLLAAALQVWWSRTTGRDDFPVAVPLHNRRGRRHRGTIGLFMGVFPLPLEINGAVTFTDVLDRVITELSAALRHSRFTVADPMGRRSFEVLLNYQTIGEEDFLGHPFAVRWLDSGVGDESLTVQIDDFARDGALALRLGFNTDAWDPRLRHAAPESILRTIDAMLAAPGGRIDETEALTAVQRAELLACNDTAVDFGRFQPVHRLFADKARAHPDRVAVEADGRTMSYRELDERSEALARGLRGAGIAVGAPVAIYMERGADLVAAVMGVLRAGCAYVPFDPEHGPGRFRAAAAASGFGAVVADAANLAEAARANVTVFDPARPAPAGAEVGLPEVGPADLAYITHTSGSTGAPKGCMVEHGNLLNSYRGWQRAFGLVGHAERHLQIASHSFDVFSGDLVRALCSGGTLVICPRAVLIDPPALLREIRRAAPTHAEFVPSVLRPLAEEARRSGRPMDNWRILVTGSELWTGRDHERLADVCGGGTRLFNAYGLSETAVTSTCAELASATGDRPVPIGRPLANQRVHLLDTALRPVPPGAVGEVFIAGAAVGRGYRDLPGATAARFLPDPFLSGARMYRTGDLARLDTAGELVFLGRRDGQVKLRGLRIEPGEIEARMRECDGVRNAAVTVDDGQRLLAYVEAAAGASITVEQLRESLSQTLPAYMVPSRFLAVPRMPITASGKLDRAGLPDPTTCTALPAIGHVAPADGLERRVAEVWCEVLGRDTVGSRDNFFDLGGHSMLLIRLKERLSAEFDREVEATDLFANPTVASMARWLADEATPAVEAPRADRAGLSSQRHRRFQARRPTASVRPEQPEERTP